jgi:cobalt-zinc-cadmium efflux system membrane fusion protein
MNWREQTMNLKIFLLICIALGLGACGDSDPGSGPVAPSQEQSEGAADKHAEEGHGDEAHEKGDHAKGDADEHGDEHDEGEEGTVRLTDDQIKSADISLIEAAPASIREALSVYGTIAPNAERVRDVVARFPGVIRTASKKIGDEVRQGETLATVESNESLQTYAVTAPLSGVVTARNANTGEQTGEKVLFTIADLSTVWVELSLFPRDVGKVRVGQSVRVTSSDRGMAGEGKIVYVAPFGSSANQTLTARVQLDNAKRLWAPGLYVTAEITLAESKVPLAVRSEALQMMETETVVFVRNAEGFETRPIRSGRSDGEWSEVVSGLQAGETYAARNSFIVKAELGKGSAEHEH